MLYTCDQLGLTGTLGTRRSRTYSSAPSANMDTTGTNRDPIRRGRWRANVLFSKLDNRSRIS